MTKKFCIVPWVRHISQDRVRASVYKTCPYLGPISGVLPKINSLDESWNSEYMKETRLKFLSGNIKCMSEKCAAFREWQHDHFFNNTSVDDNYFQNITNHDGTVDIQPSYFSVKIGEDLFNQIELPHEMGRVLNPKGDPPIGLRNNNIKHIIIGDPFNNIIVYGVLKDLCSGNVSDTEIVIEGAFFNGDGIDRDDVLVMLKRFKSVEVRLILDSIGNKFKYYSYQPYYDWVALSKNIKWILKETIRDENIFFHLRIRNHVFNINKINDLIIWRNTLMTKIGKQISLIFDPDYYIRIPEYLHPKILPDKMKAKISFDLQQFPLNRLFNKSALPFKMMAEEVSDEERRNLLYELKYYIYSVEKNKGMKFNDYFPELYQAFLDDGYDLMDFK